MLVTPGKILLVPIKNQLKPFQFVDCFKDSAQQPALKFFQCIQDFCLKRVARCLSLAMELHFLTAYLLHLKYVEFFPIKLSDCFCPRKAWFFVFIKTPKPEGK